MASEQTPMAWMDDRFNVIPQLQQPLFIAVEHGEGDGGLHRLGGVSRVQTAKPPPRPRAHSHPPSSPRPIRAKKGWRVGFGGGIVLFITWMDPTVSCMVVKLNISSGR